MLNDAGLYVGHERWERDGAVNPRAWVHLPRPRLTVLYLRHPLAVMGTMREYLKRAKYVETTYNQMAGVRREDQEKYISAIYWSYIQWLLAVQRFDLFLNLEKLEEQWPVLQLRIPKLGDFPGMRHENKTHRGSRPLRWENLPEPWCTRVRRFAYTAGYKQ